MPRWKTTENIINFQKQGEYFDENWMNYESIYQYLPPRPLWNKKRKIKFEEVDIWEVIYEEHSSQKELGVYASWSPYSHYFVVIVNWNIVGEYWGIKGEKKLQKYLSENNVPFSLNKIWIEENDLKNYLNKDDVSTTQEKNTSKPWDFLNPNTEYVDENIANKRMNICKSCDRLLKPINTCKECGCLMDLKTKLANSECPLGKW